MERPTMLLRAMLEQFSIDLDLSVERDVATLQRRFEHEGFSFLSITLPKLSDALLQGIESGRFTCPTDFCRHGSLPRFLGGFFNRVFSRDGVLLSNLDPDYIFAIRSICDFWKKPKVACSPAREEAAEAKFKKVEEELCMLQPAMHQKDKTLDHISGILWTALFPEIDPLDINCKHGPGNTADRRLSNDRNLFSWWYARSEPWFPAALHCYPNYGYAAEATMGTIDGADGFVDYREGGDEPPVRVVFVPKTLKTPRVIALEPSPMQYIQQGLLDYIVPRIESNYLTRRSIRFSDQTWNQKLAHKASLDRSLATLDLSDASDRVHVDLVRRIFKSSGVLDYLLAARSSHAELPSGDVLCLNKFASMGSAICFPVEAMVFYTLIQTAMHKQDGKRPSSRSISKYSRSIAVYGDDLIIPVEYTDSVVHNLEAYGLKVNVNKSFRNSLFRESCGADYYNGRSVRPIYARELAPNDARSWTPSQILSWTATANQFYLNGMWHISQVIREMLESVLRSPIPRSRINRGDGVVFVSTLYTTDCRYNPTLQSYEQKRTVFTPSKRKDNIDGNAISCLNRWGQYNRISNSGSRSRRAKQPTILYSSLERDTLAELERSSRALLGIQRTLPDAGSTPDAFPTVHRESWTVGAGGSIQYRSGERRDRNHASDHSVLGEMRSTGIDFQFSVNRGAFKSKRRWVTTWS